MLDMSLLRKPAFIGGLLAGFGMNGSIYAAMLYLVLYLQSGLQTSALGTGCELLVITVAAMLTSILGGRAASVVSARVLISGGLALIGVGLLLMVGMSGSGSRTGLIPGIFVAGAGSGFTSASVASVAVGAAAPEQAGMASGVNSAFRQIGMSVSVAVLGSIFAARLTSHPTAGTYADALNAVLLVAVMLAFVVAAATFVLIRPHDLTAQERLMSLVTRDLSIRIARPSRSLARAERFWTEGVGLDVLWRAGRDAIGGHALVMLGVPGAAWHLELVDDAEALHANPPGPEDLLVLYRGKPLAEADLAQLGAAGGMCVKSRNPYWDENGQTIIDPDGYLLVLSHRTWG